MQHPRLTYCRVGDRVVFLDIAADRYFCLPSRLDQFFQRRVAGCSDADSHMVAALRRAGVVDDAGAIRAVPCPGLPVAEDALSPSQRTRSLIKVAFAQSRVQARLRSWSFERVIAHERQRHRSSKPLDRRMADELSMLYAAFQALAGWFGEADRCLARSIAFRALAFQRGFAPTLVLGVKLDPFAAHCWVQSGTRIDNDAIERTRLYTPILTI